MNPKPLALVTGASSGIGMYLAHEFAKHGHNLILVAPVAQELDAVAYEIATAHGVEVLCVAKNLELPESAEEIFEEVDRQGLVVDVLVNNAGQGYKGKTWEIPIEQSIAMVRLNIEAVLKLTHMFLPAMVQRNSGRLLTTASVAGFEPGPWLNVYHSTKAFVLSWCEGLAVELEDTEVTVTALCPGPVDTDFFPKADMEATRAFQKANVMAPQDVAKAGYEAAMKGQLIVVPGTMNKVLVEGRRVLTQHAQAKLNEKMYEEVPLAERDHQRGDWEDAKAKAVAPEDNRAYSKH